MPPLRVVITITFWLVDRPVPCHPTSAQRLVDRSVRTIVRPNRTLPTVKYDSCEVGDLSGKGGALTVNNEAGGATSMIAFDPTAALVSYYQADRVTTTAHDHFASIVFHNGDGGARVLCAKLVAGKLPAEEDNDDDEEEEDVGFISKLLSLLLPCF